jgi:hypothetical protein
MVLHAESLGEYCVKYCVTDFTSNLDCNGSRRRRILAFAEEPMKLPFTLGRLLFGGFFLYSGINHFLQYKTLAQYAAAKQVPAPKVAVFRAQIFRRLSGASSGSWLRSLTAPFLAPAVALGLGALTFSWPPACPESLYSKNSGRYKFNE